MEFLKGLALNIWNNHRKKLITFVIGLILAGVAALTGIPLDELKEATHEASKPAVVVEGPVEKALKESEAKANDPVPVAPVKPK